MQIDLFCFKVKIFWKRRKFKRKSPSFGFENYVALSETLTPYLSALNFCNSPVWIIKFDEQDFFSSLNWIFLPALVGKIQIWNRLTPCWSVLELKKIKLENSSSMNWIFSLQKSISKLICVGYTGSKNQVRNSVKIKFEIV